MASTTTVKRALAALAAGHGFVPDDAEADVRDPASVVTDAERAVERLDTAADLLADDGDRRLRQAVEQAERENRRNLARRGQRVLATLDRFRAVAGDTDQSPGRRAGVGRDTTENVKRGGDQPPDR